MCDWKILPIAPGSRTVYVESPDWCDSGILYDDGRVAWDFPERIPTIIRKKAEKSLRDSWEVAWSDDD